MLDQLQKRDSYSIFAQPVSAEDVSTVWLCLLLCERLIIIISLLGCGQQTLCSKDSYQSLLDRC